MSGCSCAIPYRGIRGLVNPKGHPKPSAPPHPIFGIASTVFRHIMHSRNDALSMPPQKIESREATHGDYASERCDIPSTGIAISCNRSSVARSASEGWVVDGPVALWTDSTSRCPVGDSYRWRNTWMYLLRGGHDVDPLCRK